MANSQKLAATNVTPAKINELTFGSTAPSAPVLGDAWMDTSSGRVLKLRDNVPGWDTQSSNSPISRVYTGNPNTACPASVANTTIITASGISIPTTSGIRIQIGFSIGAAVGACALGLKFNAVTLHDTTSSPWYTKNTTTFGVATPLFAQFEWIDFSRYGYGDVMGGYDANVSAYADVSGLMNAMSSAATVTSILITGNNTGITVKSIDIWELKYV